MFLTIPKECFLDSIKLQEWAICNYIKIRKESQILSEQRQTQKITNSLIPFVPWPGQVVIRREQKGTSWGAGSVLFIEVGASNMDVFSV